MIRNLVVLSFLFLMVNQGVKGQQIDIDFPGGNIIVDQPGSTSTLYYTLDADTVGIRPDLRDTSEEWFYWMFRVNGMEGKRVYFQFPKRQVGTMGPAISMDGGQSWSWQEEKIGEGKDYFVYGFDNSGKEVCFSVGYPYLEKDFTQFIQNYIDHPQLSLSTLTKSEKGRSAELLEIKAKEATSKAKVVIAARHHANEAMVSFVLEGFIRSMLEDNEPAMAWLRQHVDFLILPFMDKDGVQDGDQGKLRKPWDHDVDYAENPIYQSTQALKNTMLNWGEGKITTVFDLHCPWLFGEWNEHIYFVGDEDPAIAQEQQRFISILNEHQSGELVLDAEKAWLPYGEGWNVWEEDGNLQVPFLDWAKTLTGVKLTSILEFPFANHGKQVIHPENARQFGRDMARALGIYLKIESSK
ncbi:M14 family zinc carboxypeptidase [Pleomorphovibrio marinus]|uniref:M14 family zinc carboxypeptidase n=1 Tax=Pleomorphovibrio marinus TaxID=2164132 RepID=UPI000E0AABE6|nr:M14 family zinc carboxypeptidase [Pleomorphovibrio marinus]